jgi:hypothetical protein
MFFCGVEAQWQLVRSSDVDMHASKGALTRRGEEKERRGMIAYRVSRSLEVGDVDDSRRLSRRFGRCLARHY